MPRPSHVILFAVFAVFARSLPFGHWDTSLIVPDHSEPLNLPHFFATSTVLLDFSTTICFDKRGLVNSCATTRDVTQWERAFIALPRCLEVALTMALLLFFVEADRRRPRFPLWPLRRH